MKTCFLFLVWTVLGCSFLTTAEAQIINTIGGNGTAGFSADGIPATTSQLNNPYGVAVDGAGNCYVADNLNNRIRKITPGGTITTIAGTGAIGYTGDGGPAIAAKIYAPHGIAVDAAGNVYFSDYGNTVIRMISTAGIITTIAGTGFVGFGASGSVSISAALNYPWGVAVDAAGNVYLADQMNNRVCKVSAAGILTTVAGTGAIGFAGDGGPAIAAKLNSPTGVAVDAAGNLYIADYANNKVRKVNTAGIISTIAGVGLPAFGYAGDGGPATLANLYYPMTVAVDVPGNVYICDRNNNCIRRISTSGIINTIAGTGTAGFSGDGGPAVAAKLDQSTGVAVRSNGDIYISDNNNNRVRYMKVGNGPFFSNGHVQNFLFCPTEFLSIDTLLRIDDIDVGQTETWSVVLGPTHGTLAAAYSAVSTGGTVTPSGLTYSPAFGYTGLDSFKVKIFDGTSYDTTTIYVNVVGAPYAGVIHGMDSVCPGFTSLLTDTVSGGTWSSSNTSIASISASGEVMGIIPGTVDITYTVTNECGTAIAVLPFKVIATTPCVSDVPHQPGSGNGKMKLWPNPCNGDFFVFVPSAVQEETNIIVTDVLGHKVGAYLVPANRNTALSAHLPPGLYFISAHTSGQQYSGKISIAE